MSLEAREILAHARPMQESDLPGVMRIERLSQPAPWPVWFFLRGIRADWSCWVWQRNGVIKGYGIMRISRGWAHILNVCVAPEYRGRGLGRSIMEHLLKVAAGGEASRAWLEVRPDNVPGVELYRSMGFRVKRRQKAYYPSRRGRRDALVMVRRLQGPHGA